MNYIDEIADRIHEIADADPRIRDRWGGDGSSPVLLRAYAGLALTKGAEATLEDVHDVWAVVMATTRPAHQYLVPMDEVPEDVQELDRPYLDAIHAAASVLEPSGGAGPRGNSFANGASVSGGPTSPWTWRGGFQGPKPPTWWDDMEGRLPE